MSDSNANTSVRLGDRRPIQGFECPVRIHNPEHCGWSPKPSNGTGFNDFREVKHHVSMTHGFRCDKCQKVLTGRKDYQEHIEKFRDEEQGAPVVDDLKTHRCVTDIGLEPGNIEAYFEISQQGNSSAAWLKAYEALFHPEAHNDALKGVCPRYWYTDDKSVSRRLKLAETAQNLTDFLTTPIPSHTTLDAFAHTLQPQDPSSFLLHTPLPSENFVWSGQQQASTDGDGMPFFNRSTTITPASAAQEQHVPQSASMAMAPQPPDSFPAGQQHANTDQNQYSLPVRSRVETHAAAARPQQVPQNPGTAVTPQPPDFPGPLGLQPANTDFYQLQLLPRPTMDNVALTDAQHQDMTPYADIPTAHHAFNQDTSYHEQSPFQIQDLFEEMRRNYLNDSAKLRNDIAQLRNDKAQLHSNIAQLQNFIAQLQTRNAQLQTVNAQLQTENAQLQTGNAQLQTENAQLHNDNDALRNKLTYVQAMRPYVGELDRGIYENNMEALMAQAVANIKAILECVKL